MLNQRNDGIGFGFDATENQFKLVLLHLTENLTWCNILTLGTNSWSSTKNDDPAVPKYNGKAYSPTTIGESIYWITTPVMNVLCFNVERRRFKVIRYHWTVSKKRLLEKNMHGVSQRSG
ncbi:hypothetical protein C5167_008578 [Papaver somniferum]|uniref:F-box associated beta-propeller type 3 domain-containing protein n=1 Tax=Papaver somniferum TaxID=3469 RepID=A0A4Y7JYX1_PAPSO|nr:hypothetical protein C5167_008578 [Papaver somniferum]